MEILEKVVEQNLGDSFRVALDLKTFKGKKKVSEHSFWFIGKKTDKGMAYLVDFDEPEESKGLRFFFTVGKTEKDARAYMYLPSTKKIMPLDIHDSSVDIGGTGLTMEDLRAFAPEPGKDAEIVKEEKVGGKECRLIKITLPDGRGERHMWISKKDLLVVKSRQVGPDGKIKRSFRVTEFFKTDQGKEFPREEEISIPDKNMKMLLRQEHAVFDVEIPDELMNPKTFGDYKWRI
jgi:hypothetical protein